MKLNSILTLALVIQLAFLFTTGSQQDDLAKSKNIMSQFAGDLLLKTESSGQDLKQWLAQQKIDVEQSASLFAVDTEELKLALKQSWLSSDLVTKLNTATVIRTIKQLTIVEGKFDPEKENDQIPAKVRAKQKKKNQGIKTVNIIQQDKAWVMSSASNYPADATKVET